MNLNQVFLLFLNVFGFLENLYKTLITINWIYLPSFILPAFLNLTLNAVLF